MHIFWHGQYTIKIQTDNTVLVIDPYSPDLGLPSFRSKGDIVALTNPEDPSMSHVSAVQGDPFIIDSPGEYSIRGLLLHAQSWHDDSGNEHSIQVWNIEGLSILHIGALNRDLSDKELQELEKNNIDILFLPVGGNGLDVQKALHLLTTIEPRIVIPIHFALPGLKEKLSGVEQFTKEMGVDASNVQNKVIIKANKLPQEELTTILLKP